MVEKFLEQTTFTSQEDFLSSSYKCNFLVQD